MRDRYLADAGESSVESRLAVGGRVPTTKERRQDMLVLIQGIEKVLDGGTDANARVWRSSDGVGRNGVGRDGVGRDGVGRDGAGRDSGSHRDSTAAST